MSVRSRLRFMFCTLLASVMLAGSTRAEEGLAITELAPLEKQFHDQVRSRDDCQRDRDRDDQQEAQVGLDLALKANPVLIRSQPGKAGVNDGGQGRRSDGENWQHQFVGVVERGHAALAERGRHRLVDDADSPENDTIRQKRRQLKERKAGLWHAAVPTRHDREAMALKTDKQRA